MKSKIHTNRIGYGVNFRKRAVCSEVGAGVRVFRLINARTKKTMMAGNIASPVYDEASKDMTAEIDFSSFSLPGTYYIKAGRRYTDSFVIADNPYKELNRALIKSFYYNRCGNTDESYAGEYAHESCHSAPALLYENKDRAIDAAGGWHDSGSYGKYAYTGCIALAHMLYAYKLFPEAFAEKGSIPGSPADMPDILSECRVELEWLLKMQARNGGVYHKVCTENISPYSTPEEDDGVQYIFPCSHQATAAFAAVAALASGIYCKYDGDFSDLLRAAAFGCWVWLCENPVYRPFENPPGIRYFTSSDAPDRNFSDTMFWAVCELYSMTGEDAFREKINELHKKACVTGFEPCSAGGFGSLAYILCKHPKDIGPERSIRLQFRIDADNLVSLSEKSGYRTAKAPGDYKANSNISIASRAITLITAYKLLKDEGYLRTAEDQFAYILGLNPMGTCYVTGFGEDSVQNPHHRPSVFDGVDAPVPGLAVAGANCEPRDDYARWNIPKGTPAAKCYCDNGFCYSTNEPYLCCGSALIFVSAFFSSGI